MAEQAQAEALRAAASYLDQAAKAGDPYDAYMHVCIAYDTLPATLEDSPIEDAISHLYTEREWKDNQSGLRWLAQAAQLRLMVGAWYAERRADGYGTDLDDQDLLMIINDWFLGAQHG